MGWVVAGAQPAEATQTISHTAARPHPFDLGDADTGSWEGRELPSATPLQPATLYDTTSTITELGFGSWSWIPAG